MDTNEEKDARGASHLHAELGREHKRVGWWVIFDEPNDTGEIPEGFFIDDDRARTFDKEPGFLRHHLEPVFTLTP